MRVPLFQIPAKSVSSGATIVITPLVWMQDHMVERCQQVGISCTKWNSQRLGEMRAQIVIVTPESAVSKTFSTFLKDLQSRQVLVRIVFDGCHRYGQHARFQSVDAAVQGIIHAGGADGVFDSHVAKAYRARVHADYEA